MIYNDRTDAGIQLASLLEKYRNTDAVVMAIPRGGVVTGYEVAKALDLPLEVVVPRKIGAPFQPEYAIGAVAGNDSLILDEQAIKRLRIPSDYIEDEIERQKLEMKRRMELYNAGRTLIPPTGKIVLLVDDGIATGYTMIAAARYIRSTNPSKLIIAVPVGPSDAPARLKYEADEIIIARMPEPFVAVGCWYRNFEQVTDDEVVELLRKSASLKQQ